MSSSFYKSKTLANRSSNLGNTSIRNNSKTRLGQSLLASDSRGLLPNSGLDNIEIEYIKNLRQQVYYLELECNYLRQQLNLNGLQTSFKYDQETKELKSEMINMQLEKNTLEKSLVEENQEKHTVLQVLEQTEKNFNQERELLLKEIANLKKQKNAVEEDLINKSVELARTRDNLEKHHFEATHSSSYFSKIESQLDNMRKDNVLIRAELTDARALLNARDNLIKELQEQLNDQNRRATLTDLKSSLNSVSAKLTLTNEVLAKESMSAKQLQDENLRMHREIDLLRTQLNEAKRESNRLSVTLEASLKQNESDLLLAKRNADLSKASLDKLQSDLHTEKALNASLQTQVEQFKLQERLEIKNQNSLKNRIKELESSLSTVSGNQDMELRNLRDELKSKQRQLEQEQMKWSHDHNTLLSAKTTLELRINELNDTIDKQALSHKVQIESHKSKLNQLQSQLDDHLEAVRSEKSNSSSLQNKIDNLIRQESIHNNMISSLKLNISELQVELDQLKQRELNLLSQLKESHHKLNLAEVDNKQLKTHIDELNLRLREIDRLKQLEDLIQTQRWGELGQLAESMKSLSRTMATTANNLNTTATSSSFDPTSTLRSSLNLN